LHSMPLFCSPPSPIVCVHSSCKSMNLDRKHSESGLTIVTDAFARFKATSGRRGQSFSLRA
jgi:hypothetical protein